MHDEPCVAAIKATESALRPLIMLVMFMLIFVIYRLNELSVKVDALAVAAGGRSVSTDQPARQSGSERVDARAEQARIGGVDSKRLQTAPTESHASASSSIAESAELRTPATCAAPSHAVTSAAALPVDVAAAEAEVAVEAAKYKSHLETVLTLYGQPGLAAAAAAAPLPLPFPASGCEGAASGAGAGQSHSVRRDSLSDSPALRRRAAAASGQSLLSRSPARPPSEHGPTIPPAPQTPLQGAASGSQLLGFAAGAAAAGPSRRSSSSSSSSSGSSSSNDIAGGPEQGVGAAREDAPLPAAAAASMSLPLAQMVGALLERERGERIAAERELEAAREALTLAARERDRLAARADESAKAARRMERELHDREAKAAQASSPVLAAAATRAGDEVAWLRRQSDALRGLLASVSSESPETTPASPP